MLINNIELNNKQVGGLLNLRGKVSQVQAESTGQSGIIQLKHKYRRDDSLTKTISQIIYSRLVNAIGSSDTTAVFGTNQLPTGVIILIDSEQIFVSGRTTTTKEYNITRGYNSTTAAAHTSRTLAYQVISTDLFKIKLYHEGIYQSETTDNQITFSNYREDSPNRILLLPALGNESFTDSDLFQLNQVGKRVKLTWTPATNSDLKSQRIYWDEGLPQRTHGDFVLLEDLSAERDYYETDILTDNKTYRFQIRSVDECGNESHNETWQSILTNFMPNGATGLIATWNSTTKKVTLSWTASTSSTDSDFAGYLIFDNWIQNKELDLAVDLDCPRAFLSGVSFEYPFILFPGDWIFQVRAIDKNGNQSDDSLIVYLSIDESFNEIPVLPKAPTGLTGVCLSGGRAKMTWYGADINIYGFTLFYSYDNILFHPVGDVIVESRTNTKTKYTFTTDILIEPGTETDVYFRVRSRNAELRYEQNTNYYLLTLDDLAPNNPTGFEVELT